MKKSLFLALLILISVVPAVIARIWTDRQGRQTDAQFVRLRGDSVVLQKGLKPLIIPLKEFCDEDQEYIKEQSKGKGGAKTPAAKKNDAESADDSPSAAKSKNAKNTDESSPFSADDEKTANAESSAEEKKPKPEKAEIPQINADGGFDARTWTDTKGNKLTASFSRLEGKVVVLLKDGMEQRFAIDQFTYNDKLYIRQAALDLQKYEKFAGNRDNSNPQGGLPQQAMASPPGMPTMSGPPGMPMMPGPPPMSGPPHMSGPPPMQSPPPMFAGPRTDPMIEAMHERAMAQQQRMTAGPPSHFSGPPMPSPPTWNGPPVNTMPNMPGNHGSPAMEHMNSLHQQMQANAGGIQPNVTFRQSSPNAANNSSYNNAYAAGYVVGRVIGIGLLVLVGVVVLAVIVKVITG